MKNKIPSKQKVEREIWKIIDEFKSKLFLCNFTFKLEHVCESEHAYAECKVCYPYLNATIRYSNLLVMELFAKGIDIKPYIIHELCHLITDPLYCKAVSRYVSIGEINDERERLTDYICNIALQL